MAENEIETPLADEDYVALEQIARREMKGKGEIPPVVRGLAARGLARAGGYPGSDEWISRLTPEGEHVFRFAALDRMTGGPLFGTDRAGRVLVEVVKVLKDLDRRIARTQKTADSPDPRHWNP